MSGDNQPVKWEIVCGAATRKARPCSRAAGYGTDHPGIGRCFLHGGSIKQANGRYSKINDVEFQSRYDGFLNDDEPLNLLPEVALFRTLLSGLVDRWNAIYGPDGALIAWHES